jgi:serine/threonine-protein kinase
MVGQLTAAGSVLGTASYISPEQASGATATPLSDVYALGVVAYQCLSGRRPFEGDNPLEIAMRHVRDTPPPLPGDTPPAVRQVVERAMAKDPGARWPNAAALAQVARRVSAQLSGGTSSQPAAATAGGPSGGPVSGAFGSPVAPVSPAVSGPPVSPASYQHAAVPPGSPVVPPGSPVVPPGSPVGPPRSPAVAGSPSVSPPLPTGPVAAGGTRIMPGGLVPGGPTSGAPTSGGHAARGSAGVPPPPSATDTSYTYLGQPPVPPPVAPPGGRSPLGGGGGNSRTGLVLVAVILGVLVLLVGGGLGVWFLTRDSTPTGNTPTNNTSAGGSPTPSVDVKSIPCNDLKNKPIGTVRRQLEQNGYVVKTEEVEGQVPGQVVDVTPCGPQPVGSTITVKVVRSARGPGGNNNTTGPSCPPGQIPRLGVCLPAPSGQP